jgi:Transglutaminase-like superfamily
MSVDAVSGRDLHSLVQLVRRVPDRFREFWVSDSMAERQFGLSRADLSAARRAGLSSATDGAEHHYDYADLHFLGLNLRRSRPHLLVLRLWSRMLETGARLGVVPVSIQYVLPNRPPGLPVVVTLPGGIRQAATVASSGNVVSVDIEMSSRVVLTEEPILRELFDEIVGLDFYYLPPALQGDVEWTTRNGLSDCITAARLLVDRCMALGIEARRSRGLLVSTPYSSIHDWAEILIDEIWTPFDPLIVKQLETFGNLSAESWPVTRSLDGLLLRLGTDAGPFQSPSDAAETASFPTTLR